MRSDRLPAPIPAPTGGPTNPTPATNNDSGTGPGAVLPAELRGFNWGALTLNLIWSIAHSSWLGLLVMVPCAGIIMPFVLGFKGNEWAWQNRKWRSSEHFKATQRMWMVCGFVVTLIFIVLVWVLVILGNSMLATMSDLSQ
jgi:hypothetical protein